MNYNRLRSLADLGIISAKKKMEALIGTIMFQIQEILPHILSITDRTTRGMLLYSLVDCTRKIHEASIDNGIHYTTYTTGMLHYYTEGVDPRYQHELLMLVESFCGMSLYSIRHQNYSEIWQLGVNGRVLVKAHPNLALPIVDTLRKSFEILRDEKDPEVKERQSKQVIEEIKSVEKSNTSHDLRVTEKVQEILSRLESEVQSQDLKSSFESGW